MSATAASRLADIPGSSGSVELVRTKEASEVCTSYSRTSSYNPKPDMLQRKYDKVVYLRFSLTSASRVNFSPPWMTA